MSEYFGGRELGIDNFRIFPLWMNFYKGSLSMAISANSSVFQKFFRRNF